MEKVNGVEPPNYTEIPNALIALMPDMNDAELRITLAISRKTFGWHKVEDELSYSQLMKLTGLSRQGVANGLDDGMERGTIQRRAQGDSFVYRLVVKEVDQHKNTSLPSRPQLVNEVDTQKKVKETKKEEERSTPPKKELPEKPNVYAAYNQAFGEPIGNFNSSSNKNSIEDLEEYPLAWIDEAFLRTSKRERASQERWKDYRRMPYALSLLNEWRKANNILPEAVAPSKPTYQRSGASKPTAPYVPPTEAEKQKFREELAARRAQPGAP